MVRIALVGLAFAVLSACATSSRVPAITSASIRPATLQPGQTAVIQVDVNDLHGIVDSIEGSLPDYPDRTFKLRDDGASPDLEADDGIWTMEVSVPFTASPGEYTIRFTALDDEGRAITVKNDEGQVVDLNTVLTVSIVYPQQDEQPEAPSQPQ